MGIGEDFMGENKTHKGIFTDSRFYYCFFTVVFILFVLITALAHQNKVLFDPDSKDYTKKWSYENGSIVDFDNLVEKDTILIHKRTNGNEINNKSLCFTSKNVYFTVYLDGDIIYDFHPDPPRLFGKAYGVFPHAVNLPLLYRDGNLEIKIDNIYPETPGYIHDMKLCNGNYYILNEMQKSAVEFLICLLMFVFGFVLFCIGVVGKYFGEKRFEIMSMGTFGMVSALWIATETPLFSLFLSAPIAVHFVDYIMLAILPLPTVLFASHITGNKDSKMAHAVSFAAAVNLLFSICSTLFGFKDYHQLLFLSHIILAVTVVVVLYFFIKSIIKKTIPKGLLIILAMTFLTPVAIGAFEMVRYRMNPAEYTGMSFYKYVLFLFIFLCGIYEFINISEMSRRSQYAEIMEELAYTDGLTGLLNREAYNKELENPMEEGDSYTFVMLDMNHLKKVNDILGHIMGDEYIKKIAEFIKTSFTSEDKCFRIGGDEFFVMAKRKCSDEKFQEALATLNQKIEQYNLEKNEKIPMSIAIGYAEYVYGKANVEEVIRIADERMYEQKKTMKKELVKME